MAVDFSNESPLAVQLQHLVQPKLAEFGWTTGGDDTTLFEYILLMLANDKNEAQVAAELSNDLLDLGPENTETQQFAQWLFEQIEVLKRQLIGGEAQSASANDQQMNSALDDGSAAGQDTDMEGAGDSAQGSIPTGPKAMRNGSGAQTSRTARGGRMLNQLNKSMNRNDDSALHRVRGGGGVGRTNSHAGGPPKGPRGQNVGRGLEAMANGRGMGNANVNMGQMNAMSNMPMGGMPGMNMPQMGGQNGMQGGMLNPQQQMALMQMYEQQAQMMQQIFSGAAPGGFVNPNFNQGGRGGKKSLQQRMDRPQRGGMNASAKFTKKENQDEAMGDGPGAENGDGMDVEGGRQDPSTSMCKFNLRCSNPDCQWVHQSPAAPPGTPVDMNTTCDFGAACKNKKCVSKHPSPAQRQKFQSEQDCVFWPNCRDPENCPYKHPTERPCRNGGDCTVTDCPYYHTTTMCKYTPCLNPRCTFKHEPGQKKLVTNKWTAQKDGEGKQHVSERKFVDENMPEESIIPGQAQQEVNQDESL